MLVVQELSAGERARFQSRLSALEKGVLYPLGSDWFEIDHGRDYFAFFDRLGATRSFVALDGEDVAGLSTAILRHVPPRAGQAAQAVWYLCDLKVHPDHRGRLLTLRLIRALAASTRAASERGYAVSMDSGDGAQSRLASMARHLVAGEISSTTRLVLFSLDAEAMRRTEPLVREQRGSVSYLDLGGRKDIVLRSTGARMPLLHVQFGPCAEVGKPEPVAGHAHMFCAVAGDPLATALRRNGVNPVASATVLCRGMEGWDWSFVLTSDI